MISVRQTNIIFWFCLFFAIVYQLSVKLVRVSSVTNSIVHCIRVFIFFFSLKFTLFFSFHFDDSYPQTYLLRLKIVYFTSGNRRFVRISFWASLIWSLNDSYFNYGMVKTYTSSNQQHQRCSPFNAIKLILLSLYIVNAVYLRFVNILER